MSEEATQLAPPASTPAPGQLSAKSFFLALGILLAIFCFLNPIWKSSRMNEWDANIWWSYAPIPLVAALFLAFEKKLGFPSLFLESMKLTFVKFSITFIASNLLWTFWGAPGTGVVERAAPREQTETSFTPHAVPPATRLSAEQTASLVGVVTDSSGQPIAGALVRIVRGLEQVVFGPPNEPIVVTHDGSRFRSDADIAQIYQRVTFLSETDEFHTAVLTGPDRQQMLNFPVLPNQSRDLMFDHAFGLTQITCSIHGKAEPGAELLIVSNPFFARTDAQGEFRFEGVPLGEVVLSIQPTESAPWSTQVEVRKDSAPLELRLP